jgi:membrane protein
MAEMKKTGIMWSLALIGLAAAARGFVTEPRPRSSQRLKSASTRVDQNATGRADCRGREANSPAEIPAQGWKDILLRTYQQFNEDRLLAIAAGVVFYALLALFPAVTALVSSYALVADAKTVNDHLGMLSGILPAGTFSVV